MDNRDDILQSEKGAEAAWRGFSTQTLYIAGRLLECIVVQLSRHKFNLFIVYDFLN